MDIIISFFRDTLVGPFYIVWVIICIILIFACIGYLAEKGINNKKEKEKYAVVDSNLQNLGEKSTGNVLEVAQTSPLEENNSVVYNDPNYSSNSDNNNNNLVSNVLEPVIDEIDTVTNDKELSPLNYDNSLENTEELKVIIPTISEDNDSMVI